MFPKISAFLVVYLLASTLAYSVAARSESEEVIQTDNAKKIQGNFMNALDNIRTHLRQIAEELLSKTDDANGKIDGTKVLVHSGKTLAGSQQELQQHQSGAILDSTRKVQANVLSPVSDDLQQELLTSSGSYNQNDRTSRLVKGLFDSGKAQHKLQKRSGTTLGSNRKVQKNPSPSVLDDLQRELLTSFGSSDRTGDTRLARGVFDAPLEFLQLAESMVNFAREFVQRLYWLYYDNYDWINSLVRTVVYNMDHLHSFSISGIRVLTQLLGYGNSLLGSWQPEGGGATQSFGSAASYDQSQWQRYYQRNYGNGNGYSQKQ